MCLDVGYWHPPTFYCVCGIFAKRFRGYGLVTLGEFFGLVTLRENVPRIYSPPRTGCQLVHGPESKPPAIYTVLDCEVLSMHPQA